MEPGLYQHGITRKGAALLALAALLFAPGRAARSQSGPRPLTRAAEARTEAMRVKEMEEVPMSPAGAEVTPSPYGTARALARSRGAESGPLARPAAGSRGADARFSRASDTAGRRRDPFRLPLPPAEAGGGGAERPRRPMVPGKHGLVISQLRLEGTVRAGAGQEDGGMIAVVTNASRVAYFLHDGDALYDGRVTRISQDSVWFEEEYLDAEGRMKARQVVKRLGAATGEEP